MRHLALPALAALALLATACAVRIPAARSRAAATAGKCPPGHQWSDGRCHEKGKGHDRAKHDR